MGRFRGSNLVAAGIFASRLAGLVRELVLSVALGVGGTTDAFRFAMRVPNILQNLLGEGALSASFIPVYARLVTKGEEGEADELAGAVLGFLAATTAVLIGLAVLLARPMVWLMTPWENNPAQYDLAVNLTRITSVGLGFLVISAWCLGILNSHRSFFLPYIAPVVWNGAQIVVLGAAIVMGWQAQRIAIAAAGAVVAGGILQLAIQVPKVRRLSPHLRPSLRRTPSVDDVLSRFAPAVGARGVVQISSFADTILAGSLTYGALSMFGYALPLYLLPISLFGFSVAATELAEMSRRSGDLDAVTDRVVPALRRVLVPGVFVATVYLAASQPMVAFLYRVPARIFGKGFGDDDVVAVSLLLTAFAIGLPATMTSRITQNTLYSLGEVRGPAKIAVVRLCVGATVGVILMFQLDWLYVDGDQITKLDSVPHWPLLERVPDDIRDLRRDTAGPPHLGVLGLGFGASTAAWTEWILLRRLLRRRLGVPVRSGWARIVTVSAVASGILMAAIAQLELPSPLDAIVIGIAGLGTYVGVLFLQGVRSPAQLTSVP